MGILITKEQALETAQKASKATATNVVVDIYSFDDNGDEVVAAYTSKRENDYKVFVCNDRGYDASFYTKSLDIEELANLIYAIAKYGEKEVKDGNIYNMFYGVKELVANGILMNGEEKFAGEAKRYFDSIKPISSKGFDGCIKSSC